MTAPSFDLVCDRGRKVLTENEALRILKNIYLPQVLDFFIDDLKSGNKIRVQEGHLEINEEEAVITQKQRIIVVEDDCIVRRSITTMLQKAGYDITGFEDGAPVLELESFEEFSLMLSDVDMPTSGVDLVRALQAKSIQIPTILMSGDIGKRKHLLASTSAQATVRRQASFPASDNHFSRSTPLVFVPLR